MNISIKNIALLTIIKASLGGGLVGLLFACSNIGDDDRLIYVDAPKAESNVLIEDFTGQKCVNCPNATDAIHEIQEAYGSDHVIAVAIHSGPFGIAYPKGLMTSLGTEYWNHWFTSEGQPIGKINRGASSNDYVNWSKTVQEELQKESDVTLTVNATYDEPTKQVVINSEILGKNGQTGSYQLWLTEDSIVAPQYLPDGSAKRDYVHNHVLREAINGSWGETITLGESAKVLKHEFNISDSYVAKNCHIVAFVYDATGVKQVVSVPVIK